MDTTLKAIAEPTRREILSLVRERERPAGDIAARFKVSRPAISQHLKVLKEAGLVTERRLGTKRLYRARPQGLRELQRYLDRFWTTRLDKLKDEVERDERRKRHG